MKPPRPASPKQRALIAYLGHQSPETATSDEAKAFINAAMENEAYQPLLSRWNIEKIKLHPDLYHMEAANQKSGRFTQIFEFCESERETYHDMDPTYWPLKKLNLKACKQAVEWLDTNYAGWDADLYDADQYGINEKVIMTYFVPAIANVAPDLIKKERSGNPNPVGRQKQPAEQTNKNQRPSKRQKRKKGCLWWVAMIIGAWIAFKVIAAFIS